MTKRMTLVANIEGEGCLGKAALDEPLFVLRANDAMAPDIIEEWIDRAHGNDVPREKIAEAEKLREEMLEWQRRNGSKIPD